ncbi:MAG: helix-turn-helix domain-containing protein [Verrucomicrobia bacterium]|nr:helix-turn-helix domain-containing protein [Verrucomicrobiota bacterium]MDE3098914.1 helix-turn-helix domain-containing protein [Verrucomicrobiota bacterium]
MNAIKVQDNFIQSERRPPVAPNHCARSLSLVPSLETDPDPQPANPPPAADGRSARRLADALVHSATFREYQRAFRAATGLPLTLRAVGGWQLAHHNDPRQNPFCALMSRASRSCAACLQMQQRVCDAVNGDPCTMRCSLGLNESAVAVRVGDEVVAFLHTGQVFFQPPTPKQTAGALERIQAWGVNVDEKEVVRSYNGTRVIGQPEYQATVRLLNFFAGQLGALANQIMLQQSSSEPAQIMRARQFIEAHYQDQLSLDAVAHEAGMSRFYFCKQFRKVTGIKFAHYIARVRVEKAKNLLLNANYRISEVAFEVGFQSLTHFNRAFKRIAGQSPTDYRRDLSRR